MSHTRNTTLRRSALAVAASTLALTAALPAAATPGPSADAAKGEANIGQPSAADKQAWAGGDLAAARAALVRTALAQRGKRYVLGAEGPNQFDCSGLIMWTYKTAIGRTIPHYSGSQLKLGRRIPLRDLKPGDLLFYGPGGSEHVSMYIGDGKMVHARNPSVGIKVNSINMGWYKARFYAAARLLPD